MREQSVLEAGLAHLAPLILLPLRKTNCTKERPKPLILPEIVTRQSDIGVCGRRFPALAPSLPASARRVDLNSFIICHEKTFIIKS